MTNDRYLLSCLDCGKEYLDGDTGFLLDCSENHGPALLRATYEQKSFKIDQSESGIFRYRNWLPIRRTRPSARKPVVFQSSRLAEKLKLQQLFIAFSGYWPEIGATMETCSFKELEAFAVSGRIPRDEYRTMVVSSAGNTGMSFLQIFSEYAIPLLVVLTEDALQRIWMTRDRHPDVKLAVLQGDADYLDVIELANCIAKLEDYFPEGGAKNVARRDGMGCVVLAAVETMGFIPNHYFQAIGSGTGGIAAWEMNQRLIGNGSYENRKMKLHFVQNKPFSIMTDAWSKGSRELAGLDEGEAKKCIHEVRAQVLTNRKPPYSIRGGVFDALTDTQGCMYAVANADAERAGELFAETEGCDLHPASEVALGGLIQAIDMGTVDKRDSILLNVTGGGMKRLEREERMRRLTPDIVFTEKDKSVDAISEKLSHLRIKEPLKKY